jgi:sec-independent protein translocase protein TatC
MNEQPPPTKMVVIKNYSPIEGIMVALKLALFGGLTISFPFVMYFIGQFVLPALKVNEKRILFKAVGFSGGLFLLGVAFCYFIVVVFALGATVQFSQWLGFGADEWRADAYLSFVVKFMLGMGLAFQLPVVILLLVKIGILDYEKLKNFRSYAFVANLTISAVVTPSGDPFTMLIMALPLHLLYEISTLVAWYWHRKELKKAQQESS